MSFISTRIINAFLALVSLCGVLFALYLQYVHELEPCPLCIFQRVGLIIMGVFAFIAFIHHSKHMWVRRLYAFFMLLAIGWSLGVAGRHVWLQHLPADQVPACGPGLDFWMEAFPFKEVLSLVLSGSGECAKVSAQFLGFSIPEWSLLFFAFLFIVVFVQLLKPRIKS